VVEGGNVLHHVKKKGKLSGRANIRGKCPGPALTPTRWSHIRRDNISEMFLLSRRHPIYSAGDDSVVL